MRKITLIVTLFTFFFSCNSFAQIGIADEFPLRDSNDFNPGTQLKLIQSDVALPGSDMHLWLQTRFLGVLETIPVKYTFVLDGMPDDSKWLDVNGMASEWASSLSVQNQVKNKNSIQSSGGASIETCCTIGPFPPSNPGTHIGDTIKVVNQCVDVDPPFGTMAQVEYDWVWQYTRDSNGDGDMDSDPDWVYVAISITFLYGEAAQLCTS